MLRMQRSDEGVRSAKNGGDMVADKYETCAREICAREVGTLSWSKKVGGRWRMKRLMSKS